MKDFKDKHQMMQSHYCWGGKAMKKAKGGYAKGGMRSENTEYAKAQRDYLDTSVNANKSLDFERRDPNISPEDFRQMLAKRSKASRDKEEKLRDYNKAEDETGYDYTHSFNNNAGRAIDRLSRSPTTDSEGNMKYRKGGTVMKAKGGNWIAGAVKNKGALHRDLGVPEGKKIPESKLNAAMHSSNPKTAKRARLAKTLKSFHKG